MLKVEIVTIFLASPGDVQAEREQARQAIEDVNRTIGRDKEVRFDVVGWETNAYPSYGSDGQDIINQQIADMAKYDLFVGILWNRFGQPTPRANSGTEEEFDRAVASYSQTGHPNIMFYFNQTPSNLTSVQDLEQKTKVLQFKKKVQLGGLTWDYNGVQDFRIQFQRHLLSWLIRHKVTIPEPPTPSSVTKLPSDHLPGKFIKNQESVSDSGMWVLLRSSFFEAQSVDEKSNRIVVQIAPRSTEDDAGLKTLQISAPSWGVPIFYAHQNSAGIAEVISAERRSVAGQVQWTIILQLEDDRGSNVTEMSYNNLSPDQIATLRARFILLNEAPQAGSSSQGLPRNSMDEKMLRALVSGINTRVELTGSAFPNLWQQFHEQPEQFLPLARLWAVFSLITSQTCEHILELTLGPLQGSNLHVRFRGRRHNRYVNQNATIIQVEGDCDLSAKSP